MDHPNPLATFNEYRQHVLRWHWLDCPEDATEAERQVFSEQVEEKIRLNYERRPSQKERFLKQRYAELAQQHLHVESNRDEF